MAPPFRGISGSTGPTQGGSLPHLRQALPGGLKTRPQGTYISCVPVHGLDSALSASPVTSTNELVASGEVPWVSRLGVNEATAGSAVSSALAYRAAGHLPSP